MTRTPMMPFYVCDTKKEAYEMVKRIREKAEEHGNVISHREYMNLIGTRDALEMIDSLSDKCWFMVTEDSPSVIQFDDDYYTVVFNDLIREDDTI